MDYDNSVASNTREYAIFALDSHGFVNSWNADAERIKGYRAKEIIGKHFSIFYPGERVVEGFPSYELREAARKGFHIDQGWRVRRDGTRFWAQVVITAQRSDDGSLFGFIQVTHDDSEARTRHQRSSRRFTDLFDLAPVGIGLFDDSDRVLHGNPALCELLGYSIDELHGKLGRELLHPDEREGGIVPPGSSEEDQHKLTRERMLVRADGRRVIAEVRSAVSMEDNGNRFWQIVFQDVTRQRRDTEVLHHQATHDELTGLPNRAGINELLERLLATDATGRVAVLYCDVDNFKRVNDSLGHQSGDELLVALARKLTAGVPEECTPARLFGDEYLIICSDLDAVGGLDPLVTKVADLLRTVVPVGGQLVRSSASIGVAVVDSAETSGEDLLRYADVAMFTAKNKGPGGVSLATPNMIGAVSSQVQLEGELHDAIRENELALHFQPIVDRHGAVVMAEALVRWPHPRSGLIQPKTILSVAEQGNMLGELDRYVLGAALREAASWPVPRGGRPVGVTVNLGSLLPDNPNFVDEVSEIIAASGIEWNRVVLEVVETALGDLNARSRQGMNELVERGVRFAVDDFGTGYSSMKRLKDLPAQIIKIDREFVVGAEHNSADFAISRAIVEMARGMGRYCVSEGVENATQFTMLDGLGVDSFQGFLFSKPLPNAEFRALLAEESEVLVNAEFPPVSSS